MSREMQPLFLNKENENQDANLKNLLENYIEKSEELEKRESRVLQQIELIQSAIASLQAWRNNRKSSAARSESVSLDLKDIEEETKKIREETQEIQEEIERKMVENHLLEREVERRKTLEDEKEIQPIFRNLIENESRTEKLGMEEIESRDSEPLSFKKKLMKLKEMEKKLKKELMLGSEEFRKKCKIQSEKIALLEWESLNHKEFIESLMKPDI